MIAPVLSIDADQYCVKAKQRQSEEESDRAHQLMDRRGSVTEGQ